MIQTEGKLFEAVQKSRIFKDSKTFVDSMVLVDADEIIKVFNQLDTLDKNVLERLLQDYFKLPENNRQSNPAIKGDIDQYIQGLWELLTRKDASVGLSDKTTKIGLPYAYIVPGGRFRELYYWDTYFTALGLAVDDRYDMIENLVRNFVFLQKIIGLIPNGNRRYYQSRSQPPVLVLLVDLLYQKFGVDYIKPYIEALETEHYFWAQKRQALTTSPLNHFCDPEKSPRPESYIEDIKLAEGFAHENKKVLYQALRSAAESGWDFSSRWMADGVSLESTCTQYILPIDLNALLYILEEKLAQYHLLLGNLSRQQIYFKKACARKKAYQAYFWDKQQKCFYDYDIKKGQSTGRLTAAIAWPLFANIADKAQAYAIKNWIEHSLLKPGGVVTTTVSSDQQWDYPNGWAPLQWITVQGLLNYGFDSLAQEIIARWNQNVWQYYQDYGVILEKYDVCNVGNRPGQGEYDVQEGFGWTNGVYQAFKSIMTDRKNSHLRLSTAKND
ncbi:trehalase family glycosidase [Facilibium subflavum]|uniref:trehalase family glycosidase n=1 Tax=Facilibium subflavum TaxID=2219058 RepID=UPI0013C360DA|nr:trehalase family glycosidase [Facilibium subflavum]